MKSAGKKSKKLITRLSTLFTVLVIVGVIFIGGMVYLSGEQSADNVNLASASNVIMPQASASSTASSTTPAVVMGTPTTTAHMGVIVPRTEVAPPAPQEAETTSPAPASASPVVSTPLVAPSTVSTTVASAGLPYSIGTFNNSFDDDDGWTSWWGNFSQSGGVLTLGANATGTGGEAFFTQSYGWSDYTFQATIDWVKGQTFGLVARYESDKDYVICNFTESQQGLITMNLDQFVEGKQTNVAWGSISNSDEIGETGIPVAIEVHGNQGECGFNGHAISNIFDGTTLASSSWGAIGFSTWDPAVNNSEIVVHNVGVISGSYNLQAYGAHTNY